MGDYTTLRFAAKLKPEAVESVVEVLYSRSWDKVNAEYASLPRASFIPFGGVQVWEEGWEEYGRNELRHGIWSVTCSIKSGATREIEKFLEILQGWVAEDCLVEILDEIEGRKDRLVRAV